MNHYSYNSLKQPCSHHWRGKWQPTPVFLPGEPCGQGSLLSCCPSGHIESDTTEATQQQQLPSHFFFFQLVPSFSWPHLPRSCFSFHTWDKEAFPSTLPLSFSSSCAHACATWERWDSRRGEIPASQLISSSGPRPTLRFLPAPGGICRCLCSASGIGGLHGRALSSPGWGRGSWCRHCQEDRRRELFSAWLF